MAIAWQCGRLYGRALACSNQAAGRGQCPVSWGACLKEWNDHEENCSDRCGPGARPGRVQQDAADNTVNADTNVENAAEADVNAATNRRRRNAADNALDAAGNAVENAGNAVDERAPTTRRN